MQRAERESAGSDPHDALEHLTDAETRQIPPERLEGFEIVAQASKTAPVIVACRNATVAAQYRAAVRAAGGNVDNLRFLVIPKRGPA